MSLYDNKISEQVDKLMPTNDYINALTKAILKNDADEKEYLIQKIKQTNQKEKEMILRDFQFDINGNYLFDVAGNLIKTNDIEDEKTTEERKSQFSKSVETGVREREETRQCNE